MLVSAYKDLPFVCALIDESSSENHNMSSDDEMGDFMDEGNNVDDNKQVTDMLSNL